MRWQHMVTSVAADREEIVIHFILLDQQFEADMKKGEELTLKAERKLQACQKCIAAQDVQSQALRAAVANLDSHYKYVHSPFNQ